MQITTAVSSSEFDWFTSCRAIDAMVMFNTPFRGQQELSLIGAEQTTSLLVVMISLHIYSVNSRCNLGFLVDGTGKVHDFVA